MKLTWISIIGCILLVFRLWLCEMYLKDDLKHRKNYLSRSLNYFVLTCWIFNLENMAFNFLWVGVVPVLWVGFFLWDMRFYRQIFDNTVIETYPQWEKKKVWLIIERLTLHPPIIILGLIPFFSGDLKGFILGTTLRTDILSQIMAIIVGQILDHVAWVIFDVRATDGSKTGKIIWVYVISASIVSTLLFFITP